MISAMRQVGAIGVAVLFGTVLLSVYRSHLVVTGLPDAAASAAKSSVVAGVGDRAEKTGSASLLDSVRHAFVTGIDTMLWVCAGIALVSAILRPSSCPGGPTATPARPRAEPIGPRAEPTAPEPPAPLLIKATRDGQNWKRDRSVHREPRPARRLARAEEGQDACCDQGARAPALRRAGLPAHHRGADRGGGGGVLKHVLPVLPHEGRPHPAGRHGHSDGRGVRAAAARTRPGRRRPRRHPGGSRVLQRGRPRRAPADLDLHHDRAGGYGPGPWDEFARTITVISEALAKRTGTPGGRPGRPGSLPAIVGVIMSITMPRKAVQPRADRGHVRAHRPGAGPARGRAAALSRSARARMRRASPARASPSPSPSPTACTGNGLSSRPLLQHRAVVHECRYYAAWNHMNAASMPY